MELENLIFIWLLENPGAVLIIVSAPLGMKPVGNKEISVQNDFFKNPVRFGKNLVNTWQNMILGMF